MKHKVELVHNLMYKGCEPHWHCTQCDVYIPIHCYTKEELENMDCKGNIKKMNDKNLNEWLFADIDDLIDCDYSDESEVETE